MSALLRRDIMRSELDDLQPELLSEYLKRGGYQGFKHALQGGPDLALQWLADANMRGRGGAAFPTHIKWREARCTPGKAHYVVVNCAEGEPGSFKDRALTSAAPHMVLEGMLIAASVIDADEIIVYVNDSFPQSADALIYAIQEISEWGILAESGFSLPIHVMLENHVYIAGEETALLSVLNGEPAQPWRKPPYPSTAGYHGQPTVVNNVETLAQVALLFQEGVEWYRATRPALFSVDGDVLAPGVYERSLGIPCGQLIADAGGTAPHTEVAAVLPGGYSMPWLQPDQLDTPMDYANLKALGTGLGASVIVWDSSTDLRQVAMMIANFFAQETCEKCPVCVKGVHNIAEAMQQVLHRPDELSLAQLTKNAGKYRHRGLCTFLDTAAKMAGSSISEFSPLSQPNHGKLGEIT